MNGPCDNTPVRCYALWAPPVGSSDVYSASIFDRLDGAPGARPRCRGPDGDFACHATTSIADAIGELRARSNAAILARDLDTVLETVDDRTVLIGGNGGVETSREANRSGWAQEFANPDFVTYVRTPAAIVANPNGQRAAESGTWIGTFRPSEGEPASVATISSIGF